MADDIGTIEIEEESIRENYTRIPNTILRDPDLSPGAKLTYALLLSYAHYDNRSFPGQVRLAHDLGGGERSVRRYMQELVSSRLLRIRRRGLGKTNVYTLAKWVGRRVAKMTDQERPQSPLRERPEDDDLDRPDRPLENDVESKDLEREEVVSLSRHILQELRQPNTPRHRASVAEKLSELLDENVADWARVRVAVDRALGLAAQTGGEFEFWRVLPRILALEGD